MTFTPASFASIAAFLVIVLFVVCAFTYALGKVNHRRTILGTYLWLALLGVIVSSGVVRDNPMPALPILFAFVNLVSLGFAISPIAGQIANTLPISYLVLFQGFRFPLELVLHSWANQGTIPYTMTWEGQNFDIVSGLLAIIAFPLAGKFRAIAWIANITGFFLLLNVMRVAMMSSPLPFAWPVEPALQLGFYLPYAFIVPVCVGGALIGHIILTRALLKNR